MDRGLAVYPSGGTVDGVCGDHVLLAPPFIIDAVASMQAAQAEGAYDIVSGDVEKLSGRPPRSLRTVLCDAVAP